MAKKMVFDLSLKIYASTAKINILSHETSINKNQISTKTDTLKNSLKDL